jgi:hypothetical protein
VRLLLARAGSLGRTATAVLTVAVLVSGTAWTIRSVGVHHVLRTQAFKHRNDWALLPGIWRRSGRWPEDPRLQAVLRQLRNQALALRTPNPGFAADWANDVWGE